MAADPPTLTSFIQATPWGRELCGNDLDRVLVTTEDRVFAKSAAIVSAAQQAEHWVGVVHGVVVQSVTHSDGYTSFLSAVGDGGWFGEGTLIKRTRWGYDAVALHETRAALVPLRTFEWLRDNHLPFNHFLQSLMNARLSTYIGMILSARHSSTEARVATALANLLDADANGSFVRLSQSELAMLAGTTRQRVNDVLKRLREHGVLVPRRQGVEVLDADALRALARAT